MRYFSILLFVMVYLSVGSVQAQPMEKCLRFGSVSTDMHQQRAVRAASLLTEQGVCVEILYAPGKRLTALLLNKELDGEFLRTPSYGHQVSSVAFMVEPPLLSTNVLLVVENPAYQKLEDIAEKNIGYVRGTDWVFDQVQNPTRLVAVSHLSQLPEMLRKRRIGGFFINELSWRDMAPRYPTLRAMKTGGISGYVWLRHEYASLGPRLSLILKNLDLRALSQ